ncbi:MAG: cytochrome c biogenesis protein CcsA [Paludibacteraceae bacterium]|nr:cytochrome c biogenesis protein CcsA [Paludibacteraceae bacterium]
MKKLSLLIIIVHCALLPSVVIFAPLGNLSKFDCSRLSQKLCIIHSPKVHSQTTLPHDVANEFGNLLVYHNNRICPLQTLARDYTIKLTGKTSYKDFSAEQVLMGWFFYYDEWRNEPMIKIKGKDAQQTLGIEGKYASFNDFTSPQGYKLTGTRGKNFSAADEKYNLIIMNLTGSLLKIFPYQTQDSSQLSTESSPKLGEVPKAEGYTNYQLSTLNSKLSTIHWFALNDNLPADMPQAEWLFIRKSMNLVAEYIAHNQYDEAIDLIRKIRKYQDTQLGSFAPSKARITAEGIYNHLNFNRPLAMALMTLGIILYIITIITNKTPRWSWLILTPTAIYLLIAVILRGYIAGHFPLSNGFETMQFLALIASLMPFITLLFKRKNTNQNSSLLTPNSSFLIPNSTLICGIALMVATMSELNPRITLLMPVLQSPLLSIHVMVIMISYALFALIVLNATTSLIKNNYELCIMNYELNIFALFLLTAGIFIGAIWANVSWGRYWGWDPKEVWALITMLIYSLPLHRSSLKIFQNPRFLNWYYIFAFLSVVITYFGVNFILGGMHSYA